MDYELCKKLKEAGFPQESSVVWYFWNDKKERIGEKKDPRSVQYKIPTLSELIAECGEGLHNLTNCGNFWQTNWKEGFAGETVGKTPEEAVANLYLNLNHTQHGSS